MMRLLILCLLLSLCVSCGRRSTGVGALLVRNSLNRIEGLGMAPENATFQIDGDATQVRIIGRRLSGDKFLDARMYANGNIDIEGRLPESWIGKGIFTTIPFENIFSLSQGSFDELWAKSDGTIIIESENRGSGVRGVTFENADGSYTFSVIYGPAVGKMRVVGAR